MPAHTHFDTCLYLHATSPHPLPPLPTHITRTHHSQGVVHVIDAVLTPKPAAAVTTEAGKKTGNRKLMQHGGGGGRGGRGAGQSQYAPTLALDSSEQAIMQAVSDGSANAVRGATQANLANSEVLSMYPEHATYADGLPGSVAAISSGGN